MEKRAADERREYLLDKWECYGEGAEQAKRFNVLLYPLCEAEATKQGRDLEHYVRLANEFVQMLHDAVKVSWAASKFNGTWFESVGEVSVTPWFWRHRQARVVLERGYTNPEFIRLDPTELVAAAEFYLNLPWLRHPLVDWVLVDAMMANELISFGEEIKKGPWVTKSLFAPWAFGTYAECKGDLFQMTKKQYAANVQVWLIGVGVFIVLPLYLAYVAATTSNHSLAKWLGWGVAIYGGLYLLGKAVQIVAYAAHRFRMRGKERHPKKILLNLYGKMEAAYNTLAAGAISPRKLRELLDSSTAEGAVWPAPVLPLVDRVIERDGAVWTPRSIHYQ